MSWSIEDVAKKVAANLPDGWAVEVNMMNSGADVLLWNPQGDRVLFDEQEESDCVVDEINRAVEQANIEEADQ